MVLPVATGRQARSVTMGSKATGPSPTRAAREARMDEEALSAASFRRRDERTDEEHPFRTLSRENKQWRRTL